MGPSIAQAVARAREVAITYYVEVDENDHPEWVTKYRLWVDDVMDNTDMTAESADEIISVVEGSGIDECTLNGLRDVALAVKYLNEGYPNRGIRMAQTAMDYFDAMPSTELRAEVQAATARS